MKQQAKIDNWQLRKDFFGDFYILVGTVKDHPRQSDFRTETQVTSPLLSIDFVNKKAETQNTIYELLTEGPKDEELQSNS